MKDRLTDLERHLDRRRVIARRIDHALGEHPDVTSVYVFGSVASGHIDDRSDVDISIVCQPAIPSPYDRAALLSTVSHGWRINHESERNPIWEAFDKGVVDSIEVEIHWHTASTISEVLDAVINQGAISTERVPFRPYTVASMVQRAWLLRDKEGVFARWRDLTAVYPDRLKQNILNHYVPILRESIAELKSTAERRIGPGIYLFFLFQAMNSLTSVLFAVNELYDPADRWEEKTILPTLPKVPRDFISRFHHILRGPFDDAGALERAGLLESLSNDVLGLVNL